MKTRAAVLTGTERDWEIMELEVDDPGPGEVLVRWVASGLCHSDDHARTGDLPVRFPLVGGHEGAGVVEKVGPGVMRLAAGDHIVTSFLPVCGHCRWCATGHSAMCDVGAVITEGCLPDGTFRFHANGDDVAQMCMLGSLSQYSTVSEFSCVKVDDDLPLETVALVGCGVPTGWCSAVYAADVVAGETVMVYGIGGVGANAIQGAAHAGAAYVIAVDPLANKREAAEDLGATHSAANPQEAHDIAQELTRGVGADKAIVTVDLVTEQVVAEAFTAVRKGGTVVITGLADPNKMTVQLPSGVLTLYQKQLKGTLFGSGNPMHDIPNLLNLYRAGKLKLDELVTKTYTLDEVNQGFRDMLDGKNIRGVVIHEH